MWKQIFDIGRQIFTLTRTSEQHDLDIKDLKRQMAETRQELYDLTRTVEKMQAEMQHDRDMAARDREILLLRLENVLLRSERNLPSPGLGNRPPEIE